MGLCAKLKNNRESVVRQNALGELPKLLFRSKCGLKVGLTGGARELVETHIMFHL